MSTTLRNLIPGEEFAERLQAFRTLLSDDGYDGALVWGRGGGAVDRYADVWYLTGYYPAFPTIRNVPDVWSDRGQCALLVTSDEVILFTDDPSAGEVAHSVTEVVVRHGVSSRTLVSDVVAALDDRPSLHRVVMVAGDAMSGTHANELLHHHRLRNTELVWNTTMLELLRMRKSENEIQLMRHAAQIAEEALEAGFAMSKPGVSESDIVSVMASVVLRREASLANAFAYTTPALGDPEESRLPTSSSRPLQDGDVFTIDLTGVFAGYFFDLARSWVIGGEPTPEQDRAYTLAKAVVDRVVEAMQPGSRLGDAAQIGSHMLREAGIDPEDAEFPARGHGLGLGFERPWVRESSDEVLEPGMVISIEQFVTLEGVSATFERNILITEHGPEDLRPVRDFWKAS